MPGMLTSSSTRLGRSLVNTSTPSSPVSATSASNFMSSICAASAARMVGESSMMRILDIQTLPKGPWRECTAALERDLGPHKELHRLDVGGAVEPKGEVGVQHVALGAARAEQAQAEADVLQPAGVLGVLVFAVPRPAAVEEHR